MMKLTHNRPLLLCLIAALALLMAPVSMAASPFDSLGGVNKRGGGMNPTSADSLMMSRGPASPLYELRLTKRDQERFNACRDDAMQRGFDIYGRMKAADYMRLPYSDPDCNRFVIESMYFGMQMAKAGNPEALAEFQRNSVARDRYDELKKAIDIIAEKQAPPPKPGKIAAPALPANLIEGEEARPNTLRSRQPQALTNTYVAPEFWALDYTRNDQYKNALAQNMRNQILRREPTESIENPLVQSVARTRQAAEERDKKARERSGLPRGNNSAR
ncbi:MAG: hypothetical protein AB7U41_03745 [Dongiaceae bacterium]